jgi:hypothetical protein
MKRQGPDYVYESAYVADGNCYTNWKGNLKCNPPIYRDLHAANILGIAGLEASVLSGRGININSNSFINDASSIISISNAKINTTLFNNNSYTFVKYDDTSRTYEYFIASIKSGDALTITQNDVDNPSLINGDNITQYSAVIRNLSYLRSTATNNVDRLISLQNKYYNGHIKSSDSPTTNQNNSVNVRFINYNILSDIESFIDPRSDIYINNDSLMPKQNEAPTFSLSSEAITSISAISSILNRVFGNFKINLDPVALNPLIESRSQFNDVSKFFDSPFKQNGLKESLVLDKIYHQIRTAPATIIVNDYFVENKLILNKLKTMTNDSIFLSKITIDPNQQIKELLNDSINQFADLELNIKEIVVEKENMETF